MILIGLMMLILGTLAFENRPFVFIEYCQIRKPLNVIRIVLQYLASRIERLKLLNQFRLELALLLHLKRSLNSNINSACHKTKGIELLFCATVNRWSIVTVLWQDKGTYWSDQVVSLKEGHRTTKERGLTRIMADGGQVP